MWKRVCGYSFLNVILLGYSDVIILGWVNGCELRASDGDFLGGFQMDPGLVIWKGTWSEDLNGCEFRASDGGFLGKIQLEPNSVMWNDV